MGETSNKIVYQTKKRLRMEKAVQSNKIKLKAKEKRIDSKK